MIYGNTLISKNRKKRKFNPKTVFIHHAGNNSKIKEACQKNKIVGKKSIKASEETGMDKDEFVHVIESTILAEDKKLPVIVKIHESKSIYIKKEINAYNRVKEFENSVQMICNFECNDDKDRWEHMINEPIKFCNNKKDSLHFLVLEYIESGDLYDFIISNPSLDILCSFILQTILSICTLSYKYKISHGDLNTGNILVGKTDKSKIIYNILDVNYSVPTFGITPKIVDYGRSMIYRNTINELEILDPIIVLLSSISSYIKHQEIKQNLKTYTENYSGDKETIHKVIMDVRYIFLTTIQK